MPSSDALTYEAAHVDYQYRRMMKNKYCFVYFPGDIPLTFIKNPLRIRMHFIPSTGRRGGIFYRPDVLHEAYQLYLALCLIDTMDINRGASKNHLIPDVNRWDELISRAFKGRVPNQGGLDPHDGIEYILMHTGQKHISWFTGAIPSEFHLNPLCIKMSHIYTPCGLGLIYYIEGQEEKARLLFEELKCIQSENNPERTKRIGKLLGYAIEDIDEFVDFMKNRMIGCRLN